MAVRASLASALPYGGPKSLAPARKRNFAPRAASEVTEKGQPRKATSAWLNVPYAVACVRDCQKARRVELLGREYLLPALKTAGEGALYPAVCFHGTNDITQAASSAATKVQDGLIYLWPSSESAADVSRNAPASILEGLEGQVIFRESGYTRLVPGAAELWVENSMDQSHITFAHHSQGEHSRGGKDEGFFEAQNLAEAGDDVRFEYGFAPTGGPVYDASTELHAPNVLRMQFKAMQKRRFWIHVTPVNSSQSLLVMQGVAPPPQDKQGWLAARFADLPIVKHVKRALSHIHLHGVTDGDIVFVYPQMLNAKEGRDEYFLPADSDRGVVAWRRWLKHNGGPQYAKRAEQAYDGLLDSSGRLRREQLLDRYSQHTSTCSSCSLVLQLTRKVRLGCLAASCVAFLNLAAALAGAIQLHPAVKLALLVALGALLWAQERLTAFSQCFTYMPHHQADLPPVPAPASEA